MTSFIVWVCISILLYIAIKNFGGRLQPKSAYCVKGNIVQEILDENIVNTDS